jgi:uncharacterized protein
VARPSGALVAVSLLLLWAAAAAALKIPPPPTHRINDFAGVLTPAERDRLEQKLIQRERGASNQVVVAIFPSLDGESLEDFSIRLAQAWRIGQKGLDNGVIFLVFVKDRKMRIEVGYGLEANLTDAISSSILRDVVAPRFRAGHIADGIGAGLDAIDQAIAGTYRQPARPARAQRPLSPFVVMLLFLLLGGLAISIIPTMFYRGSQRRGWTGGGSGWGGPMIGGGWSSGGGGDSGGGFSGGGGDFGGGGASGSW